MKLAGMPDDVDFFPFFFVVQLSLPQIHWNVSDWSEHQTTGWMFKHFFGDFFFFPCFFCPFIALFCWTAEEWKERGWASYDMQRRATGHPNLGWRSLCTLGARSNHWGTGATNQLCPPIKTCFDSLGPSHSGAFAFFPGSVLRQGTKKSKKESLASGPGCGDSCVEVRDRM